MRSSWGVGGVRSADLRTAAFGGGLQPAHQGRPVDLVLVADDLEVRQAAAFDDSVSVAGVLQPAHVADRASKRAVETDAFVAEGLEELQHRALQACSDAATAHRGEVVDRALADPAALVGQQM